MAYIIKPGQAISTDYIKVEITPTTLQLPGNLDNVDSVTKVKQTLRNYYLTLNFTSSQEVDLVGNAGEPEIHVTVEELLQNCDVIDLNLSNWIYQDTGDSVTLPITLNLEKLSGKDYYTDVTGYSIENKVAYLRDKTSETGEDSDGLLYINTKVVSSILTSMSIQPIYEHDGQKDNIGNVLFVTGLNTEITVGPTPIDPGEGPEEITKEDQTEPESPSQVIADEPDTSSQASSGKPNKSLTVILNTDPAKSLKIKIPEWLIRQVIAIQSRWYTSGAAEIVRNCEGIFAQCNELMNSIEALQDAVNSSEDLLSQLAAAANSGDFQPIVDAFSEITDLPMALLAYTTRFEYAQCYEQNKKDTNKIKEKSKPTDFIQLPRYVTREEIQFDENTGAKIYRYRVNKLWRDPRKFQLDQLRSILLNALNTILDNLTYYSELTTLKIGSITVGGLTKSVPIDPLHPFERSVYYMLLDADKRSKDMNPTDTHAQTTMIYDLTRENYPLIIEGNQWDFLYTAEYQDAYMTLCSKWEKFKLAVGDEDDITDTGSKPYWLQIPDVNVASIFPAVYRKDMFWNCHEVTTSGVKEWVDARGTSDDKDPKTSIYPQGKFIHWYNYSSSRVKPWDRSLSVAYDKMMGMTPFNLKYSAIFENVYLNSPISFDMINKFIQFGLHCEQVIKKMPTQIQNIITGIVEPMGANVMSPVGPATVITNIVQILGQFKRTISEINGLVDDILSLVQEAQNLGLPEDWTKPLKVLEEAFSKLKLPF